MTEEHLLLAILFGERLVSYLWNGYKRRKFQGGLDTLASRADAIVALLDEWEKRVKLPLAAPPPTPAPTLKK